MIQTALFDKSRDQAPFIGIQPYFQRVLEPQTPEVVIQAGADFSPGKALEVVQNGHALFSGNPFKWNPW